MSTVPSKRLYLILREDLAFKMIQGQHALAQFALEHPEAFKDWDNEYLINLAVFNGQHLRELETKLKDAVLTEMLDNAKASTSFEDYKSETTIKYSTFVEPDLESELPTAIALYHDGIHHNHMLVKGLSLATR